ncbi:spore coat protein [Clostridium magnum]|uniref:Spore coat protein F n=1 Tax=Clostridium magnum DSM 2767 TaxID=1121326 RepID=A0A161Y3C7_9CLOT|nr:spore coat protein [Clostridium magnum]KZL92529.1 spore coat protein F precursor [Clostridium magnum DSM 2767]SHI80004.1 similar to spore coat protein [Clostridium magnum DSM 2767]
MNAIIESLTGMNKMSDQVIATDFLISAKNGIVNYAAAITETKSPEVKAVLRKQLDAAILTHETITSYMMKKGYYQPYDLEEQFKVDLKTTDTALSLTERMI